MLLGYYCMFLLKMLGNVHIMHDLILLPGCTLICLSLGMPTRKGYPLLMNPSSRSTCCPLYHSERKRPGTSFCRVQFQKVAVLLTRCPIKKNTTLILGNYSMNFED